MKCANCTAEVPEESRYCLRCGVALTPETMALTQKRIADIQKRAAPPVLDPNTVAGYLQTEAGSNAVQKIIGLMEKLVAGSAETARLTLKVFAVTLAGAFVVITLLGLTRTLTSPVGTVLGVLIGYVLARMPGPGGGNKPPG